jgi:hypothetical protein
MALITKTTDSNLAIEDALNIVTLLNSAPAPTGCDEAEIIPVSHPMPASGIANIH